MQESNESIRLLKFIAEKLDRQNALIESWIKAANRQNEDWVEPDEACRLLGVKLTRSKSHRRKLKTLIRRGQIKKYQPTNPYMYYRPELNELARKLKDGKLFI